LLPIQIDASQLNFLDPYHHGGSSNAISNSGVIGRHYHENQENQNYQNYARVPARQFAKEEGKQGAGNEKYSPGNPELTAQRFQVLRPALQPRNFGFEALQTVHLVGGFVWHTCPKITQLPEGHG